MAGLLISGPAGAGKSQVAREVHNEIPESVIVDFQTLYAGLLGLERLPDGRYPERLESESYAMALAEYTRRAIITGALARELFVIATNSDGDQTRRQTLLGLLGVGATERIIDPGRATVEQRLTVGITLSDQCGEAIDRWYMRL